MTKVVDAVLDKKGNVVVPEHTVLENGVRVVDGVHYGRGKPQVHPPGARRQVSNTSGESMTKQSFADECDIQNIVKKALRGQPVSGNSEQPMYIDTAALPDYQTSLDQIAVLNNRFAGLDGLTKRQFGNDPKNMVEFLADPANYRSAVAMGLLDPSILAPAKPTEAALAAEVQPKAAQGTGA